jgi:hypothetical protein
MYKRWVNDRRAYNLTVKKDPIETGIQNAFTKVIHNHTKETQDEYYAANPDTDKHLTFTHAHICAFKLLSNDKSWCAAQCKKEQKKLPTPPFDDYCDICPKMTLITFDNDLNVIFAERTFTEDVLK